MIMNKHKITELITSREYKEARKLISDELDKKPDDVELNKLMGLCCINLNKLPEALKYFLKVLEYDADNTVALYYVSVINLDCGQFEKAEKFLTRLIELREDYLDAYKSLCIAYIKQKKYDKVFELEQRMIKINPEDVQIFDILSSAALESGRDEEAVTNLVRAVVLAPENPKYYNKLGLAYFKTGKTKKAVEMYKKSLKLNPDSTSALYNIGVAYFQVEDFEKSYKNLKKAYDIEPKLQYIQAYSLSALKAGMFEEAQEGYKKLSELEPDNDNNLYNLAVAYKGCSKYAEAIEIIEQLLSFNMNSVQLKLTLAGLYSMVNNLEAAKILYSELVSKGIMNIDMLYDYSVVCAKSGETDRGEEILKKIITVNPNYFMAYKDLAIIYLSRRIFDRALEFFEKAYAIAPDNMYVIFEFANYYHLMSELEQAEKMYSKLLKFDDVPVYMLVRIAVNYISLKNMKKAKELLLDALNIDARDVQVLFHLAQVYISENNFENAKQLLEDAYTIVPDEEIANLLARVYTELKMYKEAFMLYNVLRMANNKNTYILYCLANCKYEMKEYEEAKSYLEQILEIFPEHEDAQLLLEKINGEVKK